MRPIPSAALLLLALFTLVGCAPTLFVGTGERADQVTYDELRKRVTWSEVTLHFVDGDAVQATHVRVACDSTSYEEAGTQVARSVATRDLRSVETHGEKVGVSAGILVGATVGAIIGTTVGVAQQDRLGIYGVAIGAAGGVFLGSLSGGILGTVLTRSQEYVIARDPCGGR